jgi:hypothetical protein
MLFENLFFNPIPKGERTYRNRNEPATPFINELITICKITDSRANRR